MLVKLLQELKIREIGKRLKRLQNRGWQQRVKVKKVQLEQALVEQRAMDTAAGAGRNYATQGLPSQEAVRSYVVPQYMGGQEKFRVFVSNPGGNPVNFGNSENNAVPTNTDAVLRLRVYLEGLYKRPVS